MVKRIVTAAELVAQAEANGYKRGAYKERDTVRHRERHVKKTMKDQTIQLCLRREFASKHERLQSEIHYCHQCFEWAFGEGDWARHCQEHLQERIPDRCGTLTYCHTLVRPGHCPFCLADTAIPASQRLESWSRDHKLWLHVNDHIRVCNWPMTCPHPQCDTLVETEKTLYTHLVDNHSFSRTRPTRNDDNIGGRKRKHKDSEPPSWMPLETSQRFESSKKSRPEPPTVCPSLVFGSDMSTECRSPHGTPPSSPSTLYELAAGVGGICNKLASDNIAWDVSPRLGITSPRESTQDEKLSLDDNIFAQFVRSPSPERNESAGIGEANYPAPVTQENGESHRLRIHLRVTAPKAKVTLRVENSDMKGQNKRARSPKCKARRKRAKRKFAVL